jgi:hypothetical protein
MKVRKFGEGSQEDEKFMEDSQDLQKDQEDREGSITGRSEDQKIRRK